MARAAGKYRDQRGMPQTEDIRPQSRGASMDTPGSGSISIPLGGRDNRSAALHGDTMQGWVGGNVMEEHDYSRKHSRKGSTGNRPKNGAK